MNNQETSDNININIKNDESFQTLERAIKLSQGELSLILLRCNYQSLRQNIIQRLHNNYPYKVINLPKSVQSVYQYIREKIGYEESSILVVFGLDSVANLENILRKVNLAREEFRNNFHIPILFWVNEDTLKKIIQLAPDFHNWTKTISFSFTNDDLVELLNKLTATLFNNAGYPNSKELENHYFQNYQELITAYRVLQKRQANIPADLEACLEFIIGFDKYKKKDMESALKHYNKSLLFWEQEKKYFEKGIVELYIGIAYYRKTQPDCLQSKIYFQSCLKNFELAERQDLVCENITLLCRILKNLKEWDTLYNTAIESTKLHQNYETQLQLVEDYSFLAEARLEKLELNTVEKHAEEALLILDKISEVRPPLRSSHPRFILAKLQEKQNQIDAAIDSLEKARKEINRQYDIYGYSEILNKLKQLYFDKQQYLKAVEVKQKLIKFEQQYGLRAFVGVGYLQPSLSPVRDKSNLTEEIYVPARKKDVQNIINRLNRPECRLLVIHSFSGAGKSSLLKAGLVPALKNEFIDNTPVFPVLIRHYTDWFEKLKESFVNSLNEEVYSPNFLIEKLKYNQSKINVLIFDQFEEFFLIEKSEARRKEFYNFLCQCINFTKTKIIFSLREDYLYDLLEIERIGCSGCLKSPIDAITNILDRENRYELGNWSKSEAKEVIQVLNDNSALQLNTDFLETVINDLAHSNGKVRPIELQIIGYELQKGRIGPENYSHAFHQREEIVKKHLYHEVIEDCGEANRLLVIYILYFLTGNNETRPLKSEYELIADLGKIKHPIDRQQIDLVLKIIVTSRIVSKIYEKHDTRYQLIHDYLVSPIRQLKETKQLESERQKTEEEEKERQDSIKKQRNRLRILVVFLFITMVSFGFSWKKAADETKNTQIAEIKAISESSKALFASNQRFDALKEALRTGFKLKQTPSKDISTKVIKSLQQPIYWLLERNRLDGHGGLIWNIAFSPDGTKIASASYDKTIRVWNSDGKLLNILGKEKTQENQHEEKVYSVTFSPDSKIIASGDFDGNIKLWKLDDENFEYYEDIKDNETFLNKAHEKGIYSLAFSSDGRILASASRDGTVKLWKVDINNNSINLQQTLKNAHDNGVNTVAFSSDGKRIATGGRDNTVKLWKQNSKGEFVPDKILSNQFEDFVWSLAWSPDEKKIAIASRDSTVKLWNLENNQLSTFCSSSDCEKEPKSHKDRVMSVSFSNSGELVASASLDNTVKLWKLDSKLEARLITTLEGHSNGVYGVSFSPNCKTIVSAGADITIRLWQLDRMDNNSSDDCKASTVHKGQLGNGVITTLNSHTDKVRKVAFSPKGTEEIIATASYDNTVKLWKADGTLIKTLKGHDKKVNSLAFSPDGEIIATVSDDKTVNLWNRDGNLIRTISNFNDDLLDVSFSKDGQKLAVGLKDNTIVIINLSDDKRQIIESYSETNTDGHKDWIRAVDWSSDGNIIASASDDNTVKLWELNNNNQFEHKQTLAGDKGHNSWVFDVKFSPDGNKIASTSNDKKVILWKKDTDGIFFHHKNLERHDDEVNGVSFSPDGTRIATVSGDKTVILWYTDSDKGPEIITGHNEELYSVSFSEDGQFLVVGSGDNTAIVWDIEKVKSYEDMEKLLKRGCKWLKDYLEKKKKSNDIELKEKCDALEKA